MTWTARAGAPPDAAPIRAALDAGHAGCEAVKDRLVDYVAVRLSHPAAVPPVSVSSAHRGFGKTSLARLATAALGRPCARVACARIGSAAVLHSTPSGPPGRLRS